MYIQQNQLDDVVPPEMQDAQNLFYKEFGSNVKFVSKGYVHAWPTDVPAEQLEVSECEVEVLAGRIFNCGDDTAGNILNHLYPNIDGSTV